MEYVVPHSRHHLSLWFGRVDCTPYAQFRVPFTCLVLVGGLAKPQTLVIHASVNNSPHSLHLVDFLPVPDLADFWSFTRFCPSMMLRMIPIKFVWFVRCVTELFYGILVYVQAHQDMSSYPQAHNSNCLLLTLAALLFIWRVH